MDVELASRLFLIASLVLLTAFFVGAEFAVIKVRMSRIDQLIAEGNKKAVAAKKVVVNLDYYLSACQLGITVTALGLGALGEPTFEKLLHPLFSNMGIPETYATPIAYGVALMVMSYLHVVLGEMAPKTMAIQFAEKLTLLLAPPLVLFGKVMAPFIWLLNGSSQLFLRLFGMKVAGHDQAHSEEELKLIMTQSYHSGEINQTELAYLQNIFTFDERVARDIMVPRRQVVTLNDGMSQEERLQVIDEHRYTRYPIIENGDKDHILGYLNAKEYMTDLMMQRIHPLPYYTHPMEYVVESTPIQQVLLQMQTKRVHIAAVLDEFGGTSGIITLEDILEEIVGEIRDEFDADEQSDISQLDEHTFVVNGRVLLSDLEEQLGIHVEQNRASVDTIGGWLQLLLLENGEKHASITHHNQTWTVLERVEHQIMKAKVVIRRENK